MTCNENNCPKAKDDLKEQQEKMEIVSCMGEKGKARNSEETKKLTTGDGSYQLVRKSSFSHQ